MALRNLPLIMFHPSPGMPETRAASVIAFKSSPRATPRKLVAVGASPSTGPQSHRDRYDSLLPSKASGSGDGMEVCLIHSLRLATLSCLGLSPYGYASFTFGKLSKGVEPYAAAPTSRILSLALVRAKSSWQTLHKPCACTSMKLRELQLSKPSWVSSDHTILLGGRGCLRLFNFDLHRLHYQPTRHY